MTRDDLEARMAKSAETVRQIRAELEAKAAAGDTRAKHLLRELWPEEFGGPVEQQVNPKHWSDTDGD